MRFFLSVMSLFFVVLSITGCPEYINKTETATVPTGHQPTSAKPGKWSTGSEGALLPPAALLRPVSGNERRYDCGSIPKPFTGDMEFPSKYAGSDSARDRLNASAEKQYLAMTDSIKAFEQSSVKWADAYLSGKLGARRCLVDMLAEWSEKNALLNSSTNAMGQSVRKWALATAANSYMRVTFAKSGSAIADDKKAVIESWFLALAMDAKAYYSDRPLKKVNNHDYWAAWAVAEVAVILNRRDLFEWSMKKLDYAIDQIDERGLLPNEMRRKTRALYYHNYAMHPLSWLLLIAQANEYPLTGTQRAKIQRLVDNTISGLQDPEQFEQITGKKQHIKGLKTSHNLAWIAVWGAYTPLNKDMTDLIKPYGPLRATRMGGDVSYLLK